jgi:hypothetical protein
VVGAALTGVLLLIDLSGSDGRSSSGGSAVLTGTASTGQCVDVDETDAEVVMLKAECGEDHDAEIVAVEELNAEEAQAAEEQQVGYCAELLDEDDLTTILGRDDLQLQAVFEDPEDVKDGDTIVCYAEATKGELKEKVLD